MLEAIGAMFSYDFLRRAMIGIVLMMPLFSLLGSMVVNNRMAFFSDALGHSALTGVAVGMIFGLSDPEPAMVLFAAVTFSRAVRSSFRQRSRLVWASWCREAPAERSSFSCSSR